VIFMNAEDIAERGLRDQDWVDITSHFESETRVAPRFMVVAYEIPRRCAAAYYPEANVLVPLPSVVKESNTPAYKSIMVTVAPAAELVAKLALAGAKPERTSQAYRGGEHTGQSRDQVYNEDPNPANANLAEPGEKVKSGDKVNSGESPAAAQDSTPKVRQ